MKADNSKAFFWSTLNNLSKLVSSVIAPIILARLLGPESFGLIANDPVSELRYSKIHPITPIDYIDNVWNRDRKGMKKLTVERVFHKIIESLN